MQTPTAPSPFEPVRAITPQKARLFFHGFKAGARESADRITRCTHHRNSRVHIPHTHIDLLAHTYNPHRDAHTRTHTHTSHVTVRRKSNKTSEATITSAGAFPLVPFELHAQLARARGPTVK
ncbi:hypothetical protein MAPG_04306 [Magnaporthiopsis poae ATCC 64411]|uniref:Uncharacterized protein n=1 Tax=Magnaporthiopsis poae (strain ATCC 64411 / 73-15) TaxID=644358 RepID=A0A0C4DWD0_MAGP6|nr:hypothetical protein MAPG_04306 [Magnaporthiopsis poae ATCC 64411]